MQNEMKWRGLELLKDGTIDRILGWRAGQFVYDITPDVFSDPEDLEKNFVYNEFCGANLSKYLIAESAKEGKVAVFLKPCDTYSFNQLCTEHRIHRENVYVIGQRDGIPEDRHDVRRGIRPGYGGLCGAVQKLQEQKACGLR